MPARPVPVVDEALLVRVVSARRRFDRPRFDQEPRVSGLDLYLVPGRSNHPQTTSPGISSHVTAQRLGQLVPYTLFLLTAVGCGRWGYESHATPDLDGASSSDASVNPSGLDAGAADSDGGGCELGTIENCGACGRSCEVAGLENVTSLACIAGECVVASCASGFADCDGMIESGCETSTRTLSDCGGCGVGCALSNAVASCSTGTCVVQSCQTGFGDCDSESPEVNGCETPLDTLTDCGMCGMVCSGLGMRSCSGGSCSASGCQPGFADCDMDDMSCETDLATLADCGACGRACGTGGRLGNATATCQNRRCEIASCDANYADCDSDAGNGCEARLDGTAHCGRCNNRCGATEECQSGQCAPTYTFTPTNFDPRALPADSPDVRFDCNDTTFDSSSLTFSGPCGQNLQPLMQSGIAVIPVGNLVVTSNARLKLIGDVPVLFAVFGDATIDGVISASANGGTPGSGGNHGACGSNDAIGGDGSAFIVGGGGGGGAYLGSGGGGGVGTLARGADGGSRWGSATLTPLVGGCPGGSGGGCSSREGGAGGGAVQISATNRIVVTGRVEANGGTGPNGCGVGGGAGGGSGGAVVLEAAFVTVANAGRVEADGGDGGDAARLIGTTGRGGSAGSPNGTNGSWALFAGSGGGGGAGRIRLMSAM